MMWRFAAAMFLSCMVVRAVIVDRIAIVAGKNIIKDSDINNDLRLTEFLNQQPLAFTPTLRKKAANRLLEQGLIRGELDAGHYPQATIEEAQATLDGLIKARYRTPVAYKNALATYGISEEDLKARLLWQLTVLRFTDIRFSSAVSVSDDEIRQYYDSHKQQFGGELSAAHSKIAELLSGEQTNKAFYEWLDRQREEATIRYLEDGLK